MVDLYGYSCSKKKKKKFTVLKHDFLLKGKMGLVFHINIEEHKQWSRKSQARNLATQLWFSMQMQA